MTHPHSPRGSALPIWRSPRRLLLSLLTSLCLLLGVAAPVLADAGRFIGSPSWLDLQAELQAVQGGEAPPSAPLSPERQRRLDELNALAAAIAASDDRAQLRNDSQHSLGVFTRYKKDPADSPARFSVLGPGHETDDDFALVGLYVPAGVALAWDGASGAAAGVTAAPTARIARVLEGQRLQLRDAAEPEAGYRLNQPLLSLAAFREAADLPAPLSQEQLDQQPETAPLD